AAAKLTKFICPPLASIVLLGLEPGCPDDLTVALVIALHALGELRGAFLERLEAACHQALAHRRIVECGVDLAVEERDRRWRRAARRDDTEPGGELERRQSRLRRRRHIGRRGEALFLRHGEHAHRWIAAHDAVADEDGLYLAGDKIGK